MALGYLRDSDSSGLAGFEADGEGERWFHTGDVGEVQADGSIKIIGMLASDVLLLLLVK